MRLQVDLIHDREVLQLGPAGASLALLSFRPRGQRIVALHRFRNVDRSTRTAVVGSDVDIDILLEVHDR